MFRRLFSISVLNVIVKNDGSFAALGILRWVLVLRGGARGRGRMLESGQQHGQHQRHLSHAGQGAASYQRHVQYACSAQDSLPAMSAMIDTETSVNHLVEHAANRKKLGKVQYGDVVFLVELQTMVFANLRLKL